MSKNKRTRSKIQLLNGYWCSTPNVSPKNWQDKNASTEKDWCIQYRFYDPLVTDDKGKIIPKQVVFKGMNEVKALAERRGLCTDFIKNELDNLQLKGFNPFTKNFIETNYTPGEVDKTTNFIEACEMALLQLKCAEATKKDIKSCLGYIKKSALNLQYHNLQVQQVRRKHISLILNNCSRIKKHWSPHLFNHYRAYLMMLFKKLVELEAIDFNPVDKHLPKEIAFTPTRILPTDEEVSKILTHFADDILYLRFIHIFFHSGSREVEMLRLKTTDVDMKAEVFKVIVRKGNRTRQDERPIKKVALQYWKQLIAEAEPGQYLFGNSNLQPGNKPATRDYITKKWQREVKEKLNIPVDLYTFKHKNLDEIAAYLTIAAAQKAAGHESKIITMKYAVGEKKRENDRLRDVPNVLGG
jgi:integrase